jgi:MFS family permease
MKSPGTRPSARTAVITIAVAAMLSPLNTSMMPVALPELQREFGMSAGTSTWLLTVFALASAVGHPLAGHLADRHGPRRVLMAGLVVTGAGALGAAYATTFSLLLVLRALQALSTSAAFPAGIVLLRMLDDRDDWGRPLPPAWLGTVAMSSNLGAALGPVLGGVFVATVGWRAIFVANLPIVIAGMVLVLRQFPVDPEYKRRDGGGVAYHLTALQRPLFSVYARFAAACTVFFAGFFALPLWLVQSCGFGAVETGAMMIPMVIVSALTTPVAIRTVSRSGVAATLALGASGLCLGTALLAMTDTQSSIVAPLATMVAFGASHAFNNLGLQAELSHLASPAQLGAATGLFQAARFVGAGLAAGLVGITVANDAPTEDLHRLSVAAGIMSVVLLAWATHLLRRRGNP